jgi:hypothetical protein
MSYTFNESHANLVVSVGDNYKLQINGKVHNPENYIRMELLAPNPLDRGMSYSGAGLPYPCPTIAFDESPNFYLIPENGIISNVQFSYPNSYYTIDGNTKIPPSLFITLHPKNGEKNIHLRLELKDILPLKTLTYRPHHVGGPIYYSVKEQLVEIQGAEATARTYASYKAQYDIA